MTFSKKLKNIILILLIVALAAGVCYIYFDDEPAPQREEYLWETTLESEYIEYGGVKYEQNPNVKAVLVGGVDNYDKIDFTADSGGEADMLMLFVINSDSSTIDIMQINRDTMTLIDVLNENYITEGTSTAQIALSHAYGNGGTVSCKNTVKAVENLLFGIDIDKYLFVNMGGIPVINDFFGGVEVTVEDDFSDVDLTLVPGEKIVLNGTQALNFLRARKDLNDPSNVNRMRRHREYISGLTDNVRTRIKENSDASLELYNKLYDYMVTSLSATETASLILESSEYTINEIIVPEGTFSENSQLEEFYVDDEKLRETVIQLFYRRVYE